MGMVTFKIVVTFFLMAAYLTSGSRWYNELGSVMTITKVNFTSGSFAGTYNSAVGNATKEYELRGCFDTDGRSLGWVVSYQNKYLNAHSTASWSGQIQVTPGVQKPIILTTWLLTTQSSPPDNWASTNVGFDTFLQQQPDEKTVQLAQLQNRQSHPANA